MGFAAGPFRLADPTAEFANCSDTSLVPHLLTTIRIVFADAGRDLRIDTSRRTVRQTAGIITATAHATLEEFDLLCALAIPGGLAAIGVLRTHALRDALVIAAWALVGAATAEIHILAHATAKEFDLLYALTVPLLGAAIIILDAYTVGNRIICTAGTVLRLTAIRAAIAVIARRTRRARRARRARRTRRTRRLGRCRTRRLA